MPSVSKVLIVDDDHRMCESLKELLSSQSYELKTSNSVKETIKYLEKDVFDLVLLDIVMPNENGYKVMDYIAGQRLDTLVIIMTGHTSTGSAINALRKGAYDYLKKPFEPEELLARVKNAINHKILKDESKQAEETLRKSEEKYQNLVKNSYDIAYSVTPDGIITFIGPQIDRFGYEPEDVISKNYLEFVVPEQRQAVVNSFEKWERDGTSFPTEFQWLGKDGKRYWVEAVGKILYDDSKNPLLQIGILRDIAERKQAEEERRVLQKHLQQIQKLESIGFLAGGLAHDFNNLLYIITGNISMAKDNAKSADGIAEFLNEAERAALQAQELTKQLITFSKGGAPVKTTGPIGDLVKGTTYLSRRSSNVKSELIVPDDLWLIEFDEGQIRHAVTNITDNAIESMLDGGLIEVKAENLNITAERDLPLLEGKYVKISIRDQGIGIPEEYLSKIFDPYFSTKELGTQKGMGLGLATTYSIISRHDGHITVESEVGVGTTFTIYLPTAVEEIAATAPVKVVEPEKLVTPTSRILVMDDEEGIRKLYSQSLSRLGYEPESARDGAEAIELYGKAMETGEPFDAVILDLTIKGGMGGKDTVKALLELNPQIKAIVSSGYSNDPVMTNFRAYGFIGALPKPYAMKNLKDMLNQILGKS